MANSTEEKEIAIIGIGLRLPGANNVSEFWQNLVAGKETISRFTKKELIETGIPSQDIDSKDYVPSKGYIRHSDHFDADFFGYPPRDAVRMDPQIRLLHECSWEAIEDAGYNAEKINQKAGAFIGINENQGWLRLVENNYEDPSEQYDNYVLNFREYASTRISYSFNLTGPSFTVLTACSTSLVAVHLAMQSLLNNECEIALAGGSSISYPFKAGYKFKEGLMVSQDGHCRTFDEKASGTVFGDGVGIVVLKPLAKALRDKDNIYAVIKGSAVNNDGNSKLGYTAPSKEGQVAVIREALKNASVKPGEINYVEAHGTATQLGDPIEVEALTEAYGPIDNGLRRIGSVKTNIGHVNVASGIAALIKTALALKHNVVPPHLHFKKINSAINNLEDYFLINSKPERLASVGTKGKAGVSAFGFGGTNAHVIMEEPPIMISAESVRQIHLANVSAKSLKSLNEKRKDLLNFIHQEKKVSLADLCFTLNNGRKEFPYRASLVAQSIRELTDQLKKPYNVGSTQKQKRIVFLFPGQGSQYPGMAKDLYEKETVFREALDECNNIFKNITGDSILQLIFSTSRNKQNHLNETYLAQPAIFCISYSMVRLLQSWGIVPEALIGHSMGEFVAATVSGVFSLEEGLKLVIHRGQLIQSLPKGEMLAVSASENELTEIINGHISVAAINAPQVTVLSGSKKEAKSVVATLESKGFSIQKLTTSHPFHSSVMDPILDDFEEIFLRTTNPAPPSIPLISTVTGDWLKNGDLSTAGYWKKNIRQTVMFSSAIQRILHDENTIMIEVGPGTTLNQLARLNQNGGLVPTVISTIQGPAGQKTDDVEYLLKSIGKIWEKGCKVDWNSFYKDESRGRIPLPTYPFERKKYMPNAKESIQRTQLEQQVKELNLEDWFYALNWKRTLSLNTYPNQKRKSKVSWLVFDDESGLSGETIRELRTSGSQLTVVRNRKRFSTSGKDRLSMDLQSYEQMEKVFSHLDSHKSLPERILYFRNSTKDQDGDSSYKDFYCLLNLAKVIGKNNYTRELNIGVVTRKLHNVLGKEQIDAMAAQILGPVKVIPQEFPTIQCTNIDIDDDGKKLGNEIIAEISRLNPEHIVAFRNGYRWTQQFDRIPIKRTNPPKPVFRKDGVYLITGGVGGLGIVLAKLLSNGSKVGLILTTRSDFPKHKEWNRWLKAHPGKSKFRSKIQMLKKLTEKGARIRIVKADMNDPELLRAALRNAEKELGKINGAIHAAGLPGEGIIQLKDRQKIENVMNPKIEGTLNLVEILKNHELDFMMLCSSIASVLGGVGLVDYSSANNYMDSLASLLKLKGNGYLVSVNWDMWGQTGMGLQTYVPNELKEWFANELKNGITSREGQEIFKRILAWGGSSNVIVSTRDLQRRYDLWIKREFFKGQKEATINFVKKPKYSRPLLSTDYEKPTGSTEKIVAKVWSELFRIRKIGRRDNFFEIGGHSLLATIMVSKLRKQFDKNIHIRDVMDHPTVSDISQLIESR